MNEIKNSIVGLENMALGDEIVGRINELGAISEAPGHLTRVFLSKQHRAAADLILTWMRAAGMRAHLDAIGNVCGRYEGDRRGDFLRSRSSQARTPLAICDRSDRVRR